MEVDHLLHLEEDLEQTSKPPTERTSHHQPQHSEGLLHLLRYNDIVLDKIIDNERHIVVTEDFGPVNFPCFIRLIHQKLKSAGSMLADTHNCQIHNYCVYCCLLLSGSVADLLPVDGHNQILRQGNFLNYVGVAVV